MEVNYTTDYTVNYTQKLYRMNYTVDYMVKKTANNTVEIWKTTRWITRLTKWWNYDQQNSGNTIKNLVDNTVDYTLDYTVC